MKKFCFGICGRVLRLVASIMVYLLTIGLTPGPKTMHITTVSQKIQTNECAHIFGQRTLFLSQPFTGIKFVVKEAVIPIKML